jgi:hypothetical protein
MHRPTASILLILGLAAPAHAQDAPLPRDGDFVGWLNQNSPQRDGRPHACKAAPFPGRVRVDAYSDAYPLRLEVFAGEACAGRPLLTATAGRGEAGAWVEVDTGLSARRSVAISSADPTGTGPFAARSRFRTWGASGRDAGGPIRSPPTAGTLSAPLPPEYVPAAGNRITQTYTCKGVYLALGGAGGAPVANVSPDEHRRRASMLPELTVQEAEYANTTQGLFMLDLSMGALGRTANQAIALAAGCDRRFGFTPVTAAVSP